jgi:hypothetical protein
LGAQGKAVRIEGAEAGKRHVGGELSKIRRVITAKFRFIGRQRAGNSLDLAQGECGSLSEKLVDAAVESDGPSAVKNAAFDVDFEFSNCAEFSGGLGAKLLMPVGAKLSAP